MRSRTTAIAAAAIIFIADQLSKWLVIGPLQLQTVRQIQLLPIFNLTWTENRGISLGLLTADGEVGRWLLVAMTAIIAGGIAWWITHEHQRGDQLALGLVLGGALGNILDRVRFGYVVDFADLHFHSWPAQLCWSYANDACRPFLVFNVADAAISIGVVILLLRAFLAKPKAPEETIDHA